MEKGKKIVTCRYCKKENGEFRKITNEHEPLCKLKFNKAAKNHYIQQSRTVIVKEFETITSFRWKATSWTRKKASLLWKSSQAAAGSGEGTSGSG